MSWKPFRSRRAQVREREEEMRAHVALHTDELIARGRSPEEARREARVRFGNPRAKLEDVDALNRVFVENVGRDVSLACRSLLRAPSFSAVAVLTLALGLAGTAVMCALVHSVLLRPLPVRDQDRVVIAWKELRSSELRRNPFGAAEIEEVARASRLLQSVAGVTWDGARRWTAIEGGESTYVNGAPVTGRFFEVLGIDPALGRVLAPPDDVEGAENVLVVSHGLWQRRYGGAPDVIGRRLTFDDLPFTIVGVMPSGFDYPVGTDVWRTTRSMPINGTFGDAARTELDMMARLGPGVTIEQATSELTALTRQYEQAAPPGGTRGLLPVVRPFADHLVGEVRRPLLAVLGAVGLVLLIATANVTNLLLMRSEMRRAEVAMRRALGAGRGRIVRQLFVENLMIAVTAAAVGLVVASWALPAVVSLLPDGVPRVETVRLDTGVVVFVAGVALVAALLASLAPALFSMRLDLLSSLRSGGRGSIGSAARRGRQSLVVAQIALAVMVVAAAGLLARTMVHLQSIDTGLAADRLVFVDFVVPETTKEDRARHPQLIDAIVSELTGVPMIAAVTPVNVPPFSGGWLVPTFSAEGQSADRAAVNPSLSLESVHHSYFDTFDMAIVRGRAFTNADRRGTLDVAIVSEDVANVTWPGEEPIGKRLKTGGLDAPGEWLTVVGVAGTVRYRDLTRPHPTLYLPSAQFIQAAQTLAIRTTAPIDQVATLVRNRLRMVDPDVFVTRVAPFSELLAVPLASPRFHAFLVGLFGAGALLLSTIGLYAVMAASVRQRDREIGIRVALGATTGTVRRLVFGEALQLSGLGVVIGLGGVVLTTRLVRGMLFGVDPLDPWTLAGATLLLVAAAVLASYRPMRRAMRIDPAAMLRSD